ncbi:hypothetical protein [Amycolatopsis sp. H20-H5]|uniref:hypothetical protein n=1 Tax=Amycolatopsis sp. H20-H5 TaxID=3046309 RepID=UPI002DB96760|nr:hypothetical protein [Amycolatopsis sp. H20-H5]MEC3977240.1 hypothetical protein [Amycolatopsis sp. H20-H5]
MNDVLAVEIVDPREGVEPEGWSFFRHRAKLPPVWDYEVLRAEAWLSRNPPVLALIRAGGAVVGALSVLVCRGWREQAFAPRPSARTRRLRPRWAEVYLPLLSGYPACVFSGRLDADARRGAIRLFERELRRRLGPGLLGVVYRAMTPELVPAIDGRGRLTREIDPVAVLENRFDSAQDWAATLDPVLRKTVRAFAEDSGVHTETFQGKEIPQLPALATLLNAHRARQDDRAWRDGQRSRIGGLHLDTRSPVASAYLQAFTARPEVVTRTYRDERGRLLGFNTMFDHPTSPAVHHWAARPNADGGRKDLHVDCYARCVRLMIEHDRPELTAGRALLPVKRALGFGTRPLFSVAVPRPVLGR